MVADRVRPGIMRGGISSLRGDLLARRHDDAARRRSLITGRRGVDNLEEVRVGNGWKIWCGISRAMSVAARTLVRCP